MYQTNIPTEGFCNTYYEECVPIFQYSLFLGIFITVKKPNARNHFICHC